jgi:cytochrome c-type biogenesis protein CcmE
MKIPSSTWRIGAGVTIIVGTIIALAVTGIRGAQSYYVKINEVLTPQTKALSGDKIHHRELRVEGFVVPGSIEQSGTSVTFTMNEFESHSPDAAHGKTLKVVYKGSEPPPDTFKDNAQALAIGTYGYDGVLHANGLQAKCASKYAPAQPGATPSTPATSPGAKPNTASAPAYAPAGSPQPAAN